MVERKLVDLTKEHIALTLSWMNSEREVYSKRRTQFRKSLKALRTNSDVGNVEEPWTTERGGGRFLLSKAASVL